MNKFLERFKFPVFFQELIAFSFVGFFGIWVGYFFRNSESFIASGAPQIVWWQFLVSFGIGTALILGLIKFWHNTRILRFFFLLSIFSGLVLGFVVFFGDLLALAVSVAFLVFYIFYPKVWVHDLVLIISLAGIGGLIGASLNPGTVIILLFIMSVYDYIAVYKTKHMVKMAQAMIGQKAIFAVIFGDSFHSLNVSLIEAKPGLGFTMLGTGDFIFPLILSASTLSLSFNSALTVWAFSLLGLLFMHSIFVMQSERRPMPALPPLAAFSILGFLVAYLFRL